MTKVLFNSSRPLERAENVKTVWDAYNGDKEFTQTGYGHIKTDCDIVVTDEFIADLTAPPHCKVIMIEHGVTGFKTFGLCQPHAYVTTKQTDLIDYYIVTAPDVRWIGQIETRLPQEKILPLGLPRTDLYVGKQKGDGKTGLASWKKVYLYAPTFRRQGSEIPLPEINWGALDAQLHDYEILVVKQHMALYDKTLKQSYKHIVEVDPMLPSAPFLIDCDVIITDYSSIIFDGYMLNKPCLLVCPDIASYLINRGTYFGYPNQYSSVFTVSTYGIVEGARIADRKGLQVIEKEVIRRHMEKCDGHATERVINLINNLS